MTSAIMSKPINFTWTIDGSFLVRWHRHSSRRLHYSRPFGDANYSFGLALQHCPTTSCRYTVFLCSWLSSTVQQLHVLCDLSTNQNSWSSGKCYMAYLDLYAIFTGPEYITLRPRVQIPLWSTNALFGNLDSASSKVVRCKITYLIPDRLYSNLSPSRPSPQPSISSTITTSSASLPPPTSVDHMSHFTNDFSTSFASLRKYAQYSDVTISVCGAQFQAHKIILAARSSVFNVMFAFEDLSEKPRNIVEIDDIEPKVFEALLDYIYTTEVTDEVLHWPFAQKLMIAANKYNIEPLTMECKEAISDTVNIDIESACKIFSFAFTHGVAQLKARTIKFINRNARAVMATDGWATLIKTDSASMPELCHFAN